MADQVRERAELLRAMAEKWHDEKTLGDSSCEYRELEIHAYISGHAAATASHAAEVEAHARALLGRLEAMRFHPSASHVPPDFRDQDDSDTLHVASSNKRRAT